MKKITVRNVLRIGVLVGLVWLLWGCKQNNEGASVNTPGSLNHGILVPAYFTPNGDWGRLAAAAVSLGENLIVIANPANGPGTTADEDYQAAIAGVRSAGGKVIGYVHTCYGNQTQPAPTLPLCPKTEAAIKADVARWYQLYPRLDGIFFDEAASDGQFVAYYQRLYNDVQANHPGAMVVNNFGVVPDAGDFEIGTSIPCIFEGTGTELTRWTPPAQEQGQHSLALVHTAADLPSVWNQLLNADVHWVYVTTDTPPNPWDSLPAYFEMLVALTAQTANE